MLKIYITVFETKGDGMGVKVLEDYLVTKKDIEDLRSYDTLSFQLADKLEKVEKINDEITTPF